MIPLCIRDGRRECELNPDGIAAIEADDSPSNNLLRGFRITFKCGGIMKVRNCDDVASIEMWLSQTRFPLTKPPAPEPDEAGAEPVNG